MQTPNRWVHAAHTDTHSHCRMFQAKSYWCFALDEIRIEGRSEKKTGGLSHNTVLFVSAPTTPERLPFFPPEKSLKVGQSTLVSTCQSWLDRPIGFKTGGTGCHKNTEKKGNRWQHTARSKKRYVLVKNKHVWCLSGALQQKGEKRNVSFFYYYSNL